MNKILLRIKHIYIKHTTLLTVTESFFTAWAIMKLGNLHPMNILALFFFILSYVFISYMKKETILSSNEFIHSPKIIAYILGLLFSFFYLADQHHYLVEGLSNKLFQIIILTVSALGLFLLFHRCVYFLIYKYHMLGIHFSPSKDTVISRLPIFCFILCIICRIPWFLYSYPGILTPDSINQFEQVLGMIPYSNHHPWIHTLTISVFYHLGSFFTSEPNAAFAFYTIFQICFMAFAASYFIKIISNYIKSVKLLFGLIAIYAFLPYNNVMAISIWKDVMFAGTILIFCTSFFYLLKEGVKKHTISSALLYFVSAFLMCLYRSNGWYAFIACFPFLLYVFRKYWKTMYPLHLTLLCLVLFVKGPVMNHYNVTQPDFVESISIPLQQIGRVIATGQELTEEETILIDAVIDRSYVPQLYTEYISDNMKELVRAGSPDTLANNKYEYFKLWLALGLKYPNIYFDAYIAQTNGYYSPAITYPVAETDGVIDNETGLYREYLISNKIIVKLREISLKLQNIVPFYGSLWSMGSLFWGFLLLLGLRLSKKHSSLTYLDFVAIWLPNLAIIGTLLIATPVAIDFRYAYSLVYCIPLYFALLWIDEKVQTQNHVTSDKIPCPKF